MIAVSDWERSTAHSPLRRRQSRHLRSAPAPATAKPPLPLPGRLRRAYAGWPAPSSLRRHRDVPGAEVLALAGNRVAFRFGEQQLNVHGPGSTPDPVARVPVTPGNADLCFIWPGTAEEASAPLEARGVVVELGPVERTGGQGRGRSVYVRDPDGALLEPISYSS